MASQCRYELEHYKISPKKSLGQNFCTDKRVIDAMVTKVSEFVDLVLWEIGPGTGSLTDALINLPNELHLFEIDKRFKAILEMKATRRSGVFLHWGDFLEIDLTPLFPKNDYVVCGNLPYYCGTAIVRRLLAVPKKPKRMVFLLQKDVAEKMAADVGDEQYGFLTVAIRLFSDVLIRETFSPASFFPNPKVMSTITEFLPHSLSQEELNLRMRALQFAQVAFRHRRKMAITALESAFPEVNFALKFEKNGYSLKVRAEEISPEGFLALAII